MARLVAIALVFLVLDRLVVMVLNRVHGKWLVRVLAAVGLVLLVGGVLAMLGLIGTPPLLSSIFLGIGAVLTLRFVPALIFRGKKVEGFSRRDHAALYTALILALFWAATLYAQELGERAARNVDANPASLSLVTIFTKEHLDLPGSDVRPDMVTGLDDRPYYRYSGLSLLAYSNDRLFLVTGRYSSDFRPSIAVIRDTDAVRFEIAAPR
ncbi:hypothetical protein DMH04_32530 [Kibdelosporangium aridum]|uniref:Uncharacterized protein n=1 Tax=Kibdelosporangium aridum TaxID=2030 RepID=A0A428Z1S9_KIBAR|nr:hypothetical protein [Kibdelosporangium aridum]RSM79000.1 hypothetical protein DMH04_32530 [Kibdelosporangium aridum]